VFSYVLVIWMPWLRYPNQLNDFWRPNDDRNRTCFSGLHGRVNWVHFLCKWAGADWWSQDLRRWVHWAGIAKYDTHFSTSASGWAHAGGEVIALVSYQLRYVSAESDFIELQLKTAENDVTELITAEVDWRHKAGFFSLFRPGSLCNKMSTCLCRYTIRSTQQYFKTVYIQQYFNTVYAAQFFNSLCIEHF
jgi:hypothetical protein